jgi:hypothetical protein
MIMQPFVDLNAMSDQDLATFALRNFGRRFSDDDDRATRLHELRRYMDTSRHARYA